MPRASLGTILDDFHARWERGESPRAEDYLGLLDSREDAVELVYREYCLAEEAGLGPDPASFLSRFSSLGSSLSRLFHLHEALTASQLREWSEPALLPCAGDEIGPYRLLRSLGEGAFARVFLASQADLDGRLVVLKVCNRLTHEPRMLARLHHPNIVEIHWHGDVNAGELQLIVMPFHGGASLSAVLAELRRAGKRPREGADFLAALDRVAALERPPSGLPRAAREHVGNLSYQRTAAWMIARLAEALDHAYDRGVAHGDIKPSNVLLTADAEPMLLDFNLAAGWVRHSFETLDDAGGTLAYMPPERLLAVAEPGPTVSNRPLDRHRADIYALGVVLLEALSGRTPGLPKERTGSPRELARALAATRQRESDVLVRESGAAVPPALRAILARCLAPEPADRYGRASALAHDLECWLHDRPLEFAEQPRLRPRFVLWFQRHRIAVALAVLLAATSAAVAYIQSVRDAARRRAHEHLTIYFDSSDSGIFRFRRYDRSRIVQHGDTAENAWRHLSEWGVDRPDDWRLRDDFFYLSAREQEELALWLAEQALRFSHAIREKNPSLEHWARALSAVDRMAQSIHAAPLLAERQRLAQRLGHAAQPAPGGLAPQRWQQEYLAGVADELAKSDPQRELSHFRAALCDRPESFWAHYRAATVAFRMRDCRAAVDHLRACLTQHPRNPALWGQLAGCLYQLERFDDALEACNRAVALDPARAEAYLSRSFVHARMGQRQAQLDDVREFERLGRLRGEARLGAGRFRGFPLPYGSEADRRLWDDDLPKRILAIDPENGDALMALAYQLMYRGECQQAIDRLTAVLEFYPDFLAARYARATMRQRTKQLDGAIEDLTEFVHHQRVYEYLVDNPAALRAFHTVASHLLARADGGAEALAVAQAGLTFADQLSAYQAESHYAVARCEAYLGQLGARHLAEAWWHLAALAACPPPVPAAVRFESDRAFEPFRWLLRPALAPWDPPRYLGP